MKEELLTAGGQLGRASEFRFDYWRTDTEHACYLVKRGKLHSDGRWCITSGESMSAFWDGQDWNDEIRGPDAYKYDMEEAMLIARRLAFEENQRIIEYMEDRFPGMYRGKAVDQAARRQKK